MAKYFTLSGRPEQSTTWKGALRAGSSAIEVLPFDLDVSEDRSQFTDGDVPIAVSGDRRDLPRYRSPPDFVRTRSTPYELASKERSLRVRSR